MVITDPLTGTRNRRFFDEVIGRELQRHRRYRTPLSIVFIDVDRFKTINDTLGHETGDRVLRDVAAFLLKNIREADYVFRWGGDEFLVLITCGEAGSGAARGGAAAGVRQVARRRGPAARRRPQHRLRRGAARRRRTSCRSSRPPTSGCTWIRRGGGDAMATRARRYEGRGSMARWLRRLRASTPSTLESDTADTSRAAAASAPRRAPGRRDRGGIVAGLDPRERVARAEQPCRRRRAGTARDTCRAERGRDLEADAHRAQRDAVGDDDEDALALLLRVLARRRA